MSLSSNSCSPKLTTKYGSAYKKRSESKFKYKICLDVIEVEASLIHRLPISFVFETFWGGIDVDYCFTILFWFCFILNKCYHKIPFGVFAVWGLTCWTIFPALLYVLLDYCIVDNIDFTSHQLTVPESSLGWRSNAWKKKNFIWNKLYALNNTINYSLNYNNPLALDPNMRFSNFGSHTLMT